MKLLLIDNYDSFTYNLEHYLKALNVEVTVLRNDRFDLNGVNEYDLILISPGPGLPKEAGNTMAVIEKFAETKPILGICLGAQAIAEYFGADLYNQAEVAHGISRYAIQDGESWLLAGLNTRFKVGLYHSWAIQGNAEFDSKFRSIAHRENSILMAFEDPHRALAGIQFHPESIMTEGGMQILSNWIEKAKT